MINRDRRLFDLAEEADSLGPEARARFLERVRREDGDLATEVEAMLDAERGGATDEIRDRIGIRDVEDVLVGAEVGGYRVLEEIGRGGMGVVYRAEQLALERDVAIKVMRPESAGPHAAARFEAEQRTLAGFRHPHIARVYDGGLDDREVPFLVMEYIEGQSICDYAEAHRLTVRDRLGLFMDLCSALEYAHQRQVVHRDVKPSNVLVTGEGEVKLVDFGAAGTEGAGAGPMTVAYASPEQRREAPAAITGDVYSLGVLLGELLIGRRPETGGRLGGAAGGDSPVDRPASSPSLVKELREGLDAIIARATAASPDQRYGSAGVLSEDIRRYLANEPLVGVEESRSRKARKFVRRHRVPVGIGVLALTVLGVGLGAAFAQVVQARDEAVAEAERATRVQEFTQALFQADEGAGPADTLRVQTLLLRGLRQAEGLGDQPEVRVELLRTLGELFGSRGQYGLADSVLGLASAEGIGLWGGNDSRTVAAQLARAEVWRLQDRFDEALALVEESLSGWPDRRGSDLAVYGEGLRLKGAILHDMGEYLSAVQTLMSSIEVWNALPRGVGWSRAMTSWADVEFTRGELSTADSLNRLLLAHDQRLYGPDHPYVGAGHLTEGAIAQARGDYASAERHFRRGRSILAGYFGTSHPKTVEADVSIGRSLQYQGQLAEADSILLGALAWRIEAHGPVHGSVASVLNDLAIIAQDRQDYATSEARYMRMESIYRQVQGPDHYLVALAISNRSSMYHKAGRYVDSERAAREALSVYSRTLADDHRLVMGTRVKLGRALTSQGRFREAERPLLVGYAFFTREAPGHPSRTEAAIYLTEVYESLGEPERAAPYRAAASR